MLKKGFRISRKDFPALLTSRHFLHSEHFSLRISTSQDKHPHIGVSVSKKISKKASIRNTIRRRVYSVVFKYLKDLKPKTLLFVSKINGDKVKGKELQLEIEKLLTSGNLIERV
ncbi:MAG: ribonuclease P protein component [bacterium]|nr:ribonuclease P protein component [bacterium]